VRLVFAELKGPVKDRLTAYGLSSRFGPDRFYPTLGTAVSAYVDTSGVNWVDWTDHHAAHDTTGIGSGWPDGVVTKDPRDGASTVRR
jgi:hypothetical protein